MAHQGMTPNPYHFQADSDTDTVVREGDVSVRIYDGSTFIATVTRQRDGSYSIVDRRFHGFEFATRDDCRMYLFQRWALCPSVVLADHSRHACGPTCGASAVE